MFGIAVEPDGAAGLRHGRRTTSEATNKVLVEDAMTSSPYTVTPDTPLDEVVATMAEHKYGCAVVMQNRHLVGIFTTVDACRACADLLHGSRSRAGHRRHHEPHAGVASLRKRRTR